MKACLVRRRLAVSLFALLPGLACADATNAPPAVASPTPAPPHPPAMFHRMPADPPLPQTIDGKPIDSSFPPQALLKYLDHEVQLRVRPNAPTPYLALRSQVVMEMIPVLKKFGTKNLIKAYKLQPAPKVEKWDTPVVTQRLQQFETAIIMETLRDSVTESDFSALVALASKDPMVLFLILQNPEWEKKAEVSDLMMAKLKKLDASTTDPSTPAVLAYAQRSPNLAFQAALANVLKQWIAHLGDKQTSGNIGENVTFNNLMTESIAVNNKACEALFPDWAVAQVATFKGKASEEDKAAFRYLILATAQAFRGRPAAFAEAKIRDGITTLLAAATPEPEIAVYYDFLAAGNGDANAFKELIRADDQVGQHLAQANKPGLPPAAPQGPPQVQLGGAVVPNPYEIPSYVDALLSCVIYQGNGDKRAGVLDHVNSATYTDGQWTVIDLQFKPASSSSSNAAP